MTELSTGPEPTRWLDDPTLAGALKADLAHGAGATVTGLDTSAGLAALRGAIAAQTGALAPAAASSSFGLKAVVGVLAIGGAIGLWKATTTDAPRVEPVASAPAEPVERVASELPRAAIPHEAPVVQASPGEPEAEPDAVPEPASDVVVPGKRDDRRRDPASSKVVPETTAAAADSVDDKYLQEAMLVARARKSLASDAKATLELTEQIAKEFPSGQLVEERRALAIRALAQLGRLDEAKERAADFLADHAKGPHAAAVRRAIGDAASAN